MNIIGTVHINCCLIVVVAILSVTYLYTGKERKCSTSRHCNSIISLDDDTHNMIKIGGKINYNFTNIITV